MANLRNDIGSPAAARPGESRQAVRDRWAGEVDTSGMDPAWNKPPVDTRFGSGQMDQTGQMDMNQMDQSGQMNRSPMDQINRMEQVDWTDQMNQMNQMNQMGQTGGLQMSRNGQSPQSNGLRMQNNLPSEIIESPTTLDEAYLGSLKAMLNRNKGNYIVASFLIGTQNIVTWEGVLYDVGNDYITIYQSGRNRYIVIDMYSLKYMEFYDTRRRELCDRLLQERGVQNDWQNSW